MTQSCLRHRKTSMWWHGCHALRIFSSRTDLSKEWSPFSKMTNVGQPEPPTRPCVTQTITIRLNNKNIASPCNFTIKTAVQKSKQECDLHLVSIGAQTHSHPAVQVHSSNGLKYGRNCLFGLNFRAVFSTKTKTKVSKRV